MLIKRILTQNYNRFRFFSNTTMASQQPIHVAVIGIGLVGSEFMHQLLSLPAPSPFRVISLSSSTRTVFLGKDNPITDNRWDWKAMLASSQTPPDLLTLTTQLSALVNTNQRVALVDNTSSDEVASFYPTWLKLGIHVVTPNKKAFSGDSELYNDIVKACRETGTKCLHEATVGAGLPIIAPLKEILATGDKVRFVYFCIIIQIFNCLHRSPKLKVSFLVPCPTSSMSFRLGDRMALPSPTSFQPHVREVSPYVPLTTTQNILSHAAPSRNHTQGTISTVMMLLENLPSCPESSPILPLRLSRLSRASAAFKPPPSFHRHWRISQLGMSSSGDSPLQMSNLERSGRLRVEKAQSSDLSVSLTAKGGLSRQDWKSKSFCHKYNFTFRTGLT